MYFTKIISMFIIFFVFLDNSFAKESMLDSTLSEKIEESDIELMIELSPKTYQEFSRSCLKSPLLFDSNAGMPLLFSKKDVVIYFLCREKIEALAVTFSAVSQNFNGVGVCAPQLYEIKLDIYNIFHHGSFYHEERASKFNNHPVNAVIPLLLAKLYKC